MISRGNRETRKSGRCQYWWQKIVTQHSELNGPWVHFGSWGDARGFRRLVVFGDGAASKSDLTPVGDLTDRVSPRLRRKDLEGVGAVLRVVGNVNSERACACLARSGIPTCIGVAPEVLLSTWSTVGDAGKLDEFKATYVARVRIGCKGRFNFDRAASLNLGSRDKLDSGKSRCLEVFKSQTFDNHSDRNSGFPWSRPAAQIRVNPLANNEMVISGLDRYWNLRSGSHATEVVRVPETQ